VIYSPNDESLSVGQIAYALARLKADDRPNRLPGTRSGD